MKIKEISGAQVHYISEIYPESVTKKEAEEQISWVSMERNDQDYWNIAAMIINKLVKNE